MDQQALKDLANHLDTTLGDYLQSSEIRLGELTLRVHGDALERIIKFLRDDSACHFEMLVDVCGVDYPDRDPRFDVVYHLLSISNNLRICVQAGVDEEGSIPSVSALYSSAGWYEREVWDLYGVYFTDHPDLRRILTDYGFEGHPLRKDFPLTGYVEVRYDDEQKRVVYEPVKLTQDFRNFDFMSPWEGAKAILPGDEKAEEAAGEGEAS
ncbi:MAG: NADH-quinone oxidoreductase subunit C [Rhodospirillaceae bacterium]|nr:NADH-quinone oxidoreductase subunit C [Rhodospirillaceae bacterium]MBT5674519.1 NADH-quinone oxidoreductase subunit C [Rhodospirillaceae bacterium]MBT5779053.1 NADH-quinone oxidoreductase subunit C [Rhodospirillaceae bacterium]MBT7293502.1 NADH-quinone oxidoreductase subunit C [Rhodospirillaceae bacterium]